jgi:hypothetical protein
MYTPLDGFSVSLVMVIGCVSTTPGVGVRTWTGYLAVAEAEIVLCCVDLMMGWRCGCLISFRIVLYYTMY